MQSPSYLTLLATQDSRKQPAVSQTTGIAHIERRGESVTIRLTERMDVFSAPLLMDEFERLLSEGVLHFTVDLTPVRLVDADGDYPLLHLLKCAQEAGGSVILVCPEGNPVRIFYEMMRLDTLFEMAKTLEEAQVRDDQGPR